MRLLHVDSGREMRGGQWQALYLTEELAARGHSVKLLCAGPLLDAATKRGLDASPVSAMTMLRESRRAELVHVHDARSHTLAAAGCSAPIVVARRVAFPVRDSVASRWKYARATRYIAVSNFVRGLLVDAGIPNDRISVVHDGVPVPAELERPYHQRDPRNIVAIASEDPQKGAALLRQAADSTGLSVHYSHALWDDLPTAGLFVYLSHAEGLGSAVLLAMAHGVPVIASRVGGLPEIVEDGVTGLLTENALPDVAAAIRRVVEDPSLAARLSTAARSAAVERYAVSGMADATLAVYRTVLA